MLVQESYRGKIDDDGDFQVLAQLVNRIMNPAAFEDDYRLVEPRAGDLNNRELSMEELTVPSQTGIRDFMEWVNRLPEREPPTYLGLPANADKMLLVGQAQSTIKNLQSMSGLLNEGEAVIAEVAEVL